MTRKKLAVYLEVAPRRTFAGALEWPGWSRSAKTEVAALEALVEYGPRYAASIGRAASGVEPPESIEAVEVVERVAGNATTEFGAPGVPPSADDRPLDERELGRLSAILEAAWAHLDERATAARGTPLRKGPRGGGRELDAIIGHVLDAEGSYLGQLGRKPAPSGGESAAERAAAQRRTALDTLAARVRGEDLTGGRRKKLWSPRYFVRRAAWHVLDHAWEIEDRARPE